MEEKRNLILCGFMGLRQEYHRPPSCTNEQQALCGYGFLH